MLVFKFHLPNWRMYPFSKSNNTSMKVPSKLLHAMLITAALGATSTGCQALKSGSNDRDQNHILPVENRGIIGKIREILRPTPAPSPGSCGLCGMG